MLKYIFPTLSLLGSLLALSVAAQNEYQGQPPQEAVQLNYWNMRTYGKTGYYELFSPTEEDAFAGIYDPDGPNLPSQTIVTVDGILGYALPAGEPYAVGIVMARALYDNSPGEAWTDFGKLFDTGRPLPQSINGSQFNTYNANQFEHMHPSLLWKMIGGDPFTLSNWSTGLPGLAPFNGEAPWGYSTPLGPGRFFSQIQGVLPSLPPSVGPGGGNLVGMNIVIQIGVLDTNASTPVAPKFTLTNSLGIQAMAGPPIKLNAGNGGNWGPPLANIDFRVTRPNNSMKVDVPLKNGSTTTVPVQIINGNHVAFEIPARAATGPVAVRSSLGETPANIQPLLIVTHDQVCDLNTTPLPTFSTTVNADGARVFGTSVLGNVQLAGRVLTIPVPADINLYDLEVEIYPLDRVKRYAGLGTQVPVQMAVTPVGILPSVGAPTPTSVVPIAPGAVMLHETVPNLTGQIDLTLVTPQSTGYDFLAVIRAVEKI